MSESAGTQIRLRQRRQRPDAGAEAGRGEAPLSRPRPRAIEISAAEGTMIVRRTSYSMGALVAEAESRETITVPAFHGPTATLRVGGSITRNMGDFNSVKVEVSLSLPCYPVDAEINAAYEYGAAVLDRLLPQELSKATGEPIEQAPVQ